MTSITFTVPAIPVAQPRQRHRIATSGGNTSPRWKQSEIDYLTANYPALGKMACAKALNRTEAEVRYKASHLGLRIDKQSEFFREFQSRAAKSKTGKKRPGQSLVMKSLHAAGKLRKTPEQRRSMGERQKLWLRQNGHPRGALGMKHSPETLRKISEHSRRTWDMKTPKQKQDRIAKIMATRVKNGTLVPPRHKASWKAGWREVGGQRKYFRSRWESNYARYLEWRKSQGEIVSWEHEPEVFWFKGVKRGTVSYLPDFRVTMPDGRIEYHEVKGWMDKRSATKLRRMKKYHPTVVLLVIDSKVYRSIEQIGRFLVKGWE